MTAIGLMKGNLTTEDYNDSVASDPRVDQLRDKMTCQEDKRFSTEYLDPELRAIGNRVKVTTEDGKTYEEEISYPVGHKKRREEGRVSRWQRAEDLLCASLLTFLRLSIPYPSPTPISPYTASIEREILPTCRPSL